MTSARQEYSDTTTASNGSKSWPSQALYHRRAAVCCCIMPGEMDEGGLAMRVPVVGFTMGMALLRERMADGW